jgi:radical SAM superfamily enzyme YgiQ (UPF0313 family)
MVLEEIEACVRRGISHFAFYDDALLVNADHHLVPLLEALLDRGLKVQFHTPNGLHSRAITPALAALLRQVGFATVRLALETANPIRQQSTGAKVTNEELRQAVDYLLESGFRPEQLAAYVLAGLPDQPLAEVEATIRMVHRRGIPAKLALYSPIPGTPDGDRALPPDADPLLHNNTVYPYLLGSGYVSELQRLKHLVNAGNAALTG